MSSSPLDMLISHSVDSFEQFAEIAVSWQAEFRQMSATSGPTELLQAHAGRLLLSRASFSCMVDQGGLTPPKMRTFAIMGDNSPPMNWFGHQVDASSLLLFPRHKEIDVVSQPGFSVSTFSIPEHYLQNWFDLYGEEAFDALAGKTERIFRLKREQKRTIRKLINSAYHIVSTTTAQKTLTTDIEEALIVSLHEILIEHHCTPTGPRHPHGKALGKALELCRTQASKPLSVTDLCAGAGLSERSLQYLFRRELGTTPGSFLIGQRLYHAHRALWHADPNVNVSEIASEAGFTHFGQFAASYRRQFGELPSQTLRRLN